MSRAIPRDLWVVQAELEPLTVVHLGSGEPGASVQMPLARWKPAAGVSGGVAVREPEGGVAVTGDAIAGALREALCALRLGYAIPENAGDPRTAGIVDLLGGARGDPSGPQSRLVTYPATCATAATEIRAGVALTEHRTARPGFLYDAEVVPRGERFPIRFDLATDPWAEGPADGPGRAGLLALLAMALEGIEDGAVGFGARLSRGWGQCRVTGMRLWWYPLGDDAASWERWLRLGLGADNGVNAPPEAEAAKVEPGPEPLADRIAQAMARAVGPVAGTVADAVLAARLTDAINALRADDRRRRLDIAVDVSFPSGVLIASGAERAAGPDRAHIRSGGHDVLPGTSVAGALRAEVRAIAEACAPDHAEAWVAAAMGSEPRPETTTAASPRGSAVVVAEGDLGPASPEVPASRVAYSRLRIDPFSGGPWAHALLTEEVLYGAGGTVLLGLRLPWIEEAEDPRARSWDGVAGLAIRAVAQLARGRLALGATVAVGRGTVSSHRLGIHGKTAAGQRIDIDVGIVDDEAVGSAPTRAAAPEAAIGNPPTTATWRRFEPAIDVSQLATVNALCEALTAEGVAPPELAPTLRGRGTGT